MTTGGARQTICPLKAIWSLNSDVPVLVRPRSGNGHSPLTSSLGECVFEACSNFPAQLSIAQILQFDRHSHRRQFYRARRHDICGCKADQFRKADARRNLVQEVVTAANVRSFWGKTFRWRPRLHLFFHEHPSKAQIVRARGFLITEPSVPGEVLVH